jgi:anhydro-N-acetylmuramic acid kinase
MKSFRLIGLMSGTSLDGLDIADVKLFQEDNGDWNFELMNSKTVIYDQELKEKLLGAPFLNGESLGLLSVELGTFYGCEVVKFLDKNNIDKNQITAIASHGQTVFHQPEKGFTLQIGNGPEITAITGINIWYA